MKTAVRTNTSQDQSNAINELKSLVESKLTCSAEEKKQILASINEYFSTPKDQAYKVTHNGGSADCWANAAEFDLLRNNKELLARRISELVKDGFITASDFFNDPRPDGNQTIEGKTLGARKGVSLAFDLGVEKKFKADFGANDFQVEAFEQWIRGGGSDACSIVYNGRGISDNDTGVSQNGTSAITALLKEKNGNYAQGVRFSLQWSSDQSSAHMYHVVTVDRVAKDENGVMRVYFYQSLNMVGADRCGPNRRKECGNFESMPIDDFIKATRVAWVPGDAMKALSVPRITDPAYFQTNNKNIAEVENNFVAGRQDIYPSMTADMLRMMQKRSQEFYDALEQTSKLSQAGR